MSFDNEPKIYLCGVISIILIYGGLGLRPSLWEVVLIWFSFGRYSSFVWEDYTLLALFSLLLATWASILYQWHDLKLSLTLVPKTMLILKNSCPYDVVSGWPWRVRRLRCILHGDSGPPETPVWVGFGCLKKGIGVEVNNHCLHTPPTHIQITSAASFAARHRGDLPTPRSAGPPAISSSSTPGWSTPSVCISPWRALVIFFSLFSRFLSCSLSLV